MDESGGVVSNSDMEVDKEERGKNGRELMTEPHPRIGAGLVTFGNNLYVYGGTSEVGEKQITFDDLWKLDLNKLDSWTKVIDGTWDQLHWKGDESDSDSDDDDFVLEDSEDALDDGSISSEDDEADVRLELNELEGRNQKAIAAELTRLRERLELSDESRTPLVKESLKDFFRRTCAVWVKEVFSSTNPKEKLSGKELRKSAFQLARNRFDELFPFLQQLDELEEQQGIVEAMEAQQKTKLLEKLKSRARKRKAHLAKVAKKEKRKAAENQDYASECEKLP